MIAADGPITVERYMALCLGHPVHGYYTRRDPFGAAGDFVTAPEISQMFGELIGLWAVETWRLMGRPRPLALVELGPGRGTLMRGRSARRAGRPGFLRCGAGPARRDEPGAARGAAARACAAAPFRSPGTSGCRRLPAGPAIVVANEFFDALPVRQFVARRARLVRAPRRARPGWRARLRAVPGARARARHRRPLRRRPGAARSGACDWRERSPDWRGKAAARRSSSTTATRVRPSATRCRRCAATPSPTRSPSPARPT